MFRKWLIILMAGIISTGYAFTIYLPLVSKPASKGTFVDGYDGDVFTGKDMLMSKGWQPAGMNGGAHASFQLSSNEPQHALIEFDLSSLPSNAVIDQATLYLYHNYGSEHGGNPTWTVYSLSKANSTWIEGTKDIEPASAGEPTWQGLEADGNMGVRKKWAGSEGASTPGVDYESTPMGSVSVSAGAPYGAEFAIALNPKRVQGWVGTVNTNYGMIIITTDGSAHVATSDFKDPALYPKLVVQYHLGATGSPDEESTSPAPKTSWKAAQH